MKVIDIMYDDITDSYENVNTELETEVNSDIFGDDDFVLIIGDAYRVVDKGLIYAEGIYFTYSSYSECYEPDWDITLIYDDVENDEDFDPNKFVYFEQGTAHTAIHNYCRILG